MNYQEMFECFYDVISKGSGNEITKFFNDELNKSKDNKNRLVLLKKALLYHENFASEMTYEQKDVFETLIKELEKYL